MAAAKIWKGGDDYALGIPLDDDTELLTYSALLDIVDATLVKRRSYMGAPFDYTTIRQHS